MFFIADLGNLKARKLKALGTRGELIVGCEEVCNVKRTNSGHVEWKTSLGTHRRTGEHGGSSTRLYLS